MTRKDLLLRILEQISPDWPAASGFVLLIEQGVMDEKNISDMIQIFQRAIKETENEGLKKKLSASMAYLQRLQEMEEKSRKEEEKELLEMERMLELVG